MIYDLPTAVTLKGVEYPIRSDFREVLDVCFCLQDPEITEEERLLSALVAFYPTFDDIPQDALEEALRECFRFISCGKEEKKDGHKPKLVDWEQDFQLIVAPVNRVYGGEVRAVKYLHWWTFIALYMEIGECTFSQVVSIRDKLAKGKSLDKQEKKWYAENRDLVDFRNKYTQQDNALLEKWGGA